MTLTRCRKEVTLTRCRKELAVPRSVSIAPSRADGRGAEREGGGQTGRHEAEALLRQVVCEGRGADRRGELHRSKLADRSE